MTKTGIELGFFLINISIYTGKWLYATLWKKQLVCKGGSNLFFKKKNIIKYKLFTQPIGLFSFL